ncbi:hypothetical protein D9758_001583 [Tetrapyrgos nigripes]|uniref:Uncharacterized protein n=1 Tax=Tetrapyrgos nigripes TaxID=182062 RepID=A0A8H5LXG1_9AGAR|nr:hypothetical protein D9758_001583 [Tetrapyrgos nigripes]
MQSKENSVPVTGKRRGSARLAAIPSNQGPGSISDRENEPPAKRARRKTKTGYQKAVDDRQKRLDALEKENEELRKERTKLQFIVNQKKEGLEMLGKEVKRLEGEVQRLEEEEQNLEEQVEGWQMVTVQAVGVMVMAASQVAVHACRTRRLQ